MSMHLQMLNRFTCREEARDAAICNVERRSITTASDRRTVQSYFPRGFRQHTVRHTAQSICEQRIDVRRRRGRSLDLGSHRFAPYPGAVRRRFGRPDHTGASQDCRSATTDFESLPCSARRAVTPHTAGVRKPYRLLTLTPVCDAKKGTY
jgi:hypothetical protein